MSATISVNGVEKSAATASTIADLLAAENVDPGALVSELDLSTRQSMAPLFRDPNGMGRRSILAMPSRSSARRPAVRGRGEEYVER